MSKMNKQESDTKYMTLHRRVLKRKRSWLVGITTIVVVELLTTTAINQQTTFKKDKLVTPAHVTSKQTALINNYAQLPLQFEQNRGQTSDEVEFISHGSGYTLYITPMETVLTLQRSSDKQSEQAVVRTSFLNANIPVMFNGNTALPGKVNYLIGRDKVDWITHIPTYTDVIAKQLYPGIDLRYHGDQQQLEYDFIVSPNTNTDVIRLQIEGVEKLSLNQHGDLILKTSQGELHHKKPIIYQDINGERINIEGNYLLADNQTVSFHVGDYDPEYELIIDPVLDYSTYLGGNKRDEGIAVALDDDGNAYVIGTTKSKDDFPVVNPIQSMIDDKEDVFISKLSADGSTLLYSTYLGGKKDDEGKDIVVDTNGHAIITGDTKSKDDFPLVNAWQPQHGGDKDAFIAKLSPDGSALIFSTYFGGHDEDEGEGIAVDTLGNIVITGETESKPNDGFPILNALQATLGGDDDAYVAKLSSDGSTLLFSTYLGGNEDEESEAIALDSNDNIYITGETESEHDFPLVNAAQGTHGGKDDAFVAKLSSDGSTLLYATYLGGDKDDEAEGIAVNANGEAIVTGETESKENQNFPLVNAIQPNHGGKDDAFITKLSANGGSFLYSTYLGGSKDEAGEDIAVDAQGNAYIIGTTESNNFPTVDAIQNTREGKEDVFIAKLSDDGSSLIYSTYFGGKKDDDGEGIAVDSNGNVIIVGKTKSKDDFPLENAVQALFGGGDKDAFIAKIGSGNQAPEITSSPITTGLLNQLYTYDVDATDDDGDTLTYSLNQFPTGMSIDDQTGVISWLADVIGDVIVEVEVSDDNGGTDTQLYTLTITGDNQAPTITSTAITEALTNQLYTYDVDATDPDNEPLIYSLQVFPTGMIIDSSSGVISWTPTSTGDFSVTVLVDDNNGGTDSQSFIITVTDPDVTAPTITISSPQDNLITNQASQTIIGTLDEAATLTLNGNPVTVNPDLSFSAPVILVEGVNTFNFDATDTATNIGTATLTLNLDTVLPVITITSPQDGFITNQATQTITGSLSEAATLTINGLAVTVNPDLSFSTDVTLIEGANAIAIEATDTATNVDTTSLTLNLDTVLPVITITSPPDNLLTNQATQTITGTLSEVATLTINGQTVTVNPDLSFSSDVTLIEGANVIAIEATDDATNIGTASLTLNLDTVAPMVTVTTPPEGLITNQASQTITGSLSETATLTINGQAVTVNPDNSYSFAVTLSEGQNTFTIDAIDAATNVGSASLTLNLDTVAPVATITTPADGLLTNNPIQLVTGSVSEAASLTINGQVVSLNPDNSFSFGPITLNEGANTITAIATDVASNNSTTTVNVSLDTIAPVISVTSPVDGTLTNQNQITVVGSLSELGNLNINGQAVSVNSDGSFSTTVSLVEGANTITLTASDTATNASQTQLTVTSDTIAPVINVTTPVNGSSTNQTAQLVTGSLSEAATLLINGQAVTVNPDLSFSFGPITLVEGINSINISATDAATNNSALNISVTLDTVAPVLILDSPTGDILTNQSSVSFSGNVNETVSLSINGQAVTQNPDNTFSANVTVAEGANVVDVVATDVGGNSVTQSINVTVDTIAPSTPIISLINRGNPLNEIVMVTGLPGAAEAGTLVHIVNPTNNYEALILAQSDGSFSTDVSGFANDTFTIFAVDAAGNISSPAVLIPNPPLALTLDAIGNKNAPLGQITRFTVTANDSTGDPITLGVTPVPLPVGMEYNIATGEFSFRPTSGQEGDYDLTFSALSGDERVTETLTVTVPAPNSGDPTVFTGRVLDAQSMSEGTLVPVVGATITFLNSGISTTTDVNGDFTLINLQPTAEVFSIDSSTANAGPNGASYASFREAINLEQNVANIVERPFTLPRIATESLTTVDPAQITVVNNPTLGISITVPANTAFNQDGTPFTGQLSISEVPRDLAPAVLPEAIDPTMLITIQPAGVTFSTPVPITFPNNDNLTPGSEVDIWSLDPNTGQFGVVGTGQVTPDGTQIVTISGGIQRADWHGLLPLLLDFIEDLLKPDKDNRCDCPKKPVSSTVTMTDGRMGTEFTLPAYRSLEASRALSFGYQTNRAHPMPVIPFNAGVSVRSTVPPTVSASITVAGLQQGQEGFINTSVFSESQDEPFRSAVSFSAVDFATGMYDYRIKITSNFGPSATATRVSNFIDDQIIVENEVNSPFGAGWMLKGLYKLAFNLDGSVLLVSPEGRPINYRPSGTPNIFDSPKNDFAIFIRNSDGSYTHTEKDGVKMHFDAQGLITEHEDRNNNITAYAYDIDDKLLTITDPVGLITTFVYDINGLLQTVTDPASRVNAFEYDAIGNLIKITFPDNTFKTFEYDNRHLMIAHEDERQNRFTDRYDDFGRIIDATLPDGTIRAATNQNATGVINLNSGVGTEATPTPVARPADIDADYVDGRGNPSRLEIDSHGRSLITVDEVGRVTTHVRDADSNPTQTTRPIGSVVTRTFDNFGNVLTQKEEFNTATTTYVYDQFSLVTSVTNPRNNTTSINRDAVNGNPLSIVNALGHTTTMVYDSRGLVTTMTSPNNLVTTYTYNVEGLMDTKTETPPAGSPGNIRVWTYSYFPTGLLQTVNTPDNITLTYSYDARSYLTSVTDNLNQTILYTYDEYKNVIKTDTSSSDGSLALLVDSIYDNRNRLTQTKAPHVGIEESITQRILDENSNLIGLIDPNGNPSSNTYDPFNRLDSNTHRESGVTGYSYDDQDRIINVIAPNGVVTNYEYDIISRRTKEISPDRGTITYNYDLANNVTNITEGRGITATMSYDNLERVATKTYPNTLIGKNENVTYTYDVCNFGLGYLCTRDDESGAYDYDYDAFGNMTDDSFTEIEGTVYTMNYQYDDGDNLIQMTLPSGRVIDYARDGVRRVEGIDTTMNGAAQNIVSNIQYRGDNQETQCTLGNGLIDSRSYDLQGRLTTQQLADTLNTIIDQRSYSYDKNSNVLNIDTNFEDNDYAYDKLDRILNDAVSNNPNVNSVPTSYTYDLNDNRLTDIRDDASFDEILSYVASSNRINVTDALQIGTTPIPAIPDRDLIYNDVGRLFQLIEAGTLTAEYIYNDAGQRTRKTNFQADGITVDNITIYHYDQMGYLVTETTETGSLIKDYIWKEGMTPMAQIDNTAGTESIVYLYTDHLMTNRLATDDTQQVVWRWEGEAFGNTAAEELSGVSVNLRFPGQYYDNETNLHYNYYRYYDPSLGRYITSDPIGLRSGPNTYLYALANPIRYIDPYGLFGLNNDEMQTLIDAVNGDPKAIDKMGELEDAQRDAVVEAMEDVKEGAEVVKDDPRLRPIPKGVGSAVRRVKDFWEDLRDFFGDDRKDPDDCPQ
jgi:RHS repeat-associated protein